ncbi:hypothetical protein BKA64DRAFT_711457 [Cadophora sp. MPI-SDFR-AT-0126]|nr:hypothetical protein BKA64DRAFT_711457 [Leotiomycetes sp. MPI-SDFR-AT-0126]
MAPIALETDTTIAATAISKPADSIHTSIYYHVPDPKHLTEKPYDLRYDARGVIPQKNYDDEPHVVTIQNFRRFQTQSTDAKAFEEFGFCTRKIEIEGGRGRFGVEEAEDEEIVRERYYPAIDRMLRGMFHGVKGIVVLEPVLRKRDEKYHPEARQEYDDPQPVSVTHIDFTPYSCDKISRAMTSAPAKWSGVLALNVWKSFHAGNDWPLALCDSRTVDRNHDTIPADVVFHNRFVENQRVYYNPAHQWYYVKDLQDDEVIVFRQDFTGIEGGGGVAHCGVHNPDADEGAKARESLEVRAFVFLE